MTLVFVAPANASIIYDPNDDRYQLTATTTPPYSSVVEILLPGSLGRCTGWMYAPNMVATAGHCVYDKTAVTNGTFDITGMTVWPGRNGTSTPYGSCGVVASYVPAGWTSGQTSTQPGNEAFDYGALKLNCTIGNSTGLLSYGANPTLGYSTRVCGYPYDKTVDTMWCSDNTVRAADAYQVYYANDTVKRMSGSPVMEWTGTAWNVIAIHTMNVHGTAPNHSSYNHGTRITSTVANDLYNWRYSVP
ncbi:trypsin-like serine peptidase [Jatrophihabitans sp.]|uniref:trypsin-like serine peptidase n=1 Tax=Jatrophihabitans sp. TaxID=1932789 RepID=UPI002CBDADC8|nr:trypsin-like serine protease [Jatrophihabitans sp.]